MNMSQAVQLDAKRRREISMYGCTEAELRESVEDSINFKFSGPVMVAMGLLSDCQEMIAYDPCDGDTVANIMETQRQTLNQAKWILSTYCMKGE